MRDRANKGIGDTAIALGIFGSLMPFNTPQHHAKLLKHLIENEMPNGELILLDGAMRLAPK